MRPRWGPTDPRLIRGSDLPTPGRGLDHMGMAAPVYYTAEMVRGLPDDGNRYETVHGELLVTPAPRALHQIVLVRLSQSLGRYLERHPVGQLLYSPADLSWGPDILVQPDIFLAPWAEVRTLTWERIQLLAHAVALVLGNLVGDEQQPGDLDARDPAVHDDEVVIGQLGDEGREDVLQAEAAPEIGVVHAVLHHRVQIDELGLERRKLGGELRHRALQLPDAGLLERRVHHHARGAG